MTTRSATQKPPKKNNVPLLLFLVCSLSFLLVFVARNGFVCHTAEPVFHRSVEEALPRSNILAVKEDVALPDPVSHRSSVIFRETGDGPSAKGGNSAAKRMVANMNSALLLRATRPDPRSRRFSARAEEFFRGCGSRFFMTWISSLESFGRREMLAMESLFKFHPGACLLVLSNTMDSAAGVELLRPLTRGGHRVAAMSPDYAHLFEQTPAERWFARLQRGEVKPGAISLGQNISNLLRLAVLYRFGGTYVDTDVIFVRSIHGLKNAIGAQQVNDTTGEWCRLNNAVLIFDKKHPLLYKFIEEFAQTFDGSRWGHNGPYLVSRVVERVVGKPGYEFTVLPPHAFYPVGWKRIGGLFHGPHGVEHSKWIAKKLRGIQEWSFAVHLWNRQSKGEVIEEGSVIAQIHSAACIFCDSPIYSSNR